MLELHVWGPAFGLPSIDAHCLASIAYLQQAIPRGKWQLVASSDPALSPTNELPALRDGDTWIGGFRNIFHYIAQYSAGEWVLDAGLSELESADCIAFSSFAESNGQSLIDLSLYVSSKNYSAITRPIFNTIQSFPLPYLTPPSLRAAAKARTEHLGLSSLDIDTEDGVAPERSIIPESLRRPRSTVSSLLSSTPEAGAQIRLDALATNFLEPLEKLKGKKKYFVSDSQFSSLDCLVLGYLCLMLVPELPQPWLSNSMQKKFPNLTSWTEEMRKTVYSSSVSLNDAFLTKLGDSELDMRLHRLRARSHLPWKAAENRNALSTATAFTSGIVDAMPIIGQFRRNTKMRQHGGKTAEASNQGTSWEYLTLVGSIVAGLGLGIGYMVREGLLPFPAREEEQKSGTGLDAFGEAGEALGFFASQIDLATQRQRELLTNSSLGTPVVEVDVEVDKTP